MKGALRKICDDKRRHVAARKAQLSVSDLDRLAKQAPPVRGFHAALKVKSDKAEYGLIAEFKKGSPSKGVIRENADPAFYAQAYERGGADCISVLTDAEHFMGCDADLQVARKAAALPLLRKDFMVDVWQVAESRMLGADCILIIMAALEDALAAEIEAAAIEYGMDSLIEIHDRSELDRALKLRSQLLGINNRDLGSLRTSLSVTLDLAPVAAASGRYVVAESGLRDRQNLAFAWKSGARSFLIGESLMVQNHPQFAVESLLGPRNR